MAQRSQESMYLPRESTGKGAPVPTAIIGAATSTAPATGQRCSTDTGSYISIIRSGNTTAPRWLLLQLPQPELALVLREPSSRVPHQTIKHQQTSNATLRDPVGDTAPATYEL
jgi:hypothetical protein